MIEVEDMSNELELGDVDAALAEFSFDDDGRITLTLANPIKFGEQVFSELRFREVKGRDMRTLRAKPDQPTAIIMELAGKLAGVPTQVIDELRASDLRKVMSIVGGFMSGSLDAGEKSSGA